ncbi:carboxypeptidase regulatory-like domain-containing protein, partial [Candidatus Saccharibacteria bacterium]|nr:carboxypeptidase regulatory-like domain-containing protein [Candidatus Saccharibacteria bacterium]
INYWTSVGGTTEIWNKDLTPNPAVETITKYFSPESITGNIKDELDNKMVNVAITLGTRHTVTDKNGIYAIPYLTYQNILTAQKEGFDSAQVLVSGRHNIDIVLEKTNRTLIYRIRLFLHQLFRY